MEFVAFWLFGLMLTWIAFQFMTCGPRRKPLTQERAKEILELHRGKVTSQIEFQGYQRLSGYRTMRL